MWILPVGIICEYCGDNGIRTGGRVPDKDKYKHAVSLALSGYRKRQIAERLKISRWMVWKAMQWYKKDSSEI